MAKEKYGSWDFSKSNNQYENSLFFSLTYFTFGQQMGIPVFLGPVISSS
jgi:hypothetical protein